MIPGVTEAQTRDVWRLVRQHAEQYARLADPMTDSCLHIHLGMMSPRTRGFLFWEVGKWGNRECRPIPRFDLIRIQFNDLAQGKLLEHSLSATRDSVCGSDILHKLMKLEARLTLDSPSPWLARARLFGPKSKLLRVLLTLRPTAEPVWTLTVQYPSEQTGVLPRTEEREVLCGTLERYIDTPSPRAS